MRVQFTCHQCNFDFHNKESLDHPHWSNLYHSEAETVIDKRNTFVVCKVSTVTIIGIDVADCDVKGGRDEDVGKAEAYE